MKLIAFDHVDLYNYAVQRVLETPIEFFRKCAIDNATIDIETIEVEIETILSDLNKLGFYDNTHFVIICGSTLSRNQTINTKDLPQNNLHLTMMVDRELRESLASHSITLPTSLQLHTAWEDKSKAIERYKHISFVDIDADFNTTKLLLEDSLPIDIKVNKIELYFGKPGVTYNVIVSPYDFYNSNYDKPIVCQMTPKVRRLLKTRVDRVIDTIMS